MESLGQVLAIASDLHPLSPVVLLVGIAGGAVRPADRERSRFTLCVGACDGRGATARSRCRFQLLGYSLLVVSFVLILRVLLIVFRPER